MSTRTGSNRIKMNEHHLTGTEYEKSCDDLFFFLFFLIEEPAPLYYSLWNS